jgi:hypothetical protein
VEIYVVENEEERRWFERIVVVAPDLAAARELAAPVAAREDPTEAAKAATVEQWMSPTRTTVRVLDRSKPGVLLTGFDTCRRTVFEDDVTERGGAGAAGVYLLELRGEISPAWTDLILVRAPNEAAARSSACKHGVTTARTAEARVAWSRVAGVKCTPVDFATAHVVYGERVS